MLCHWWYKNEDILCLLLNFYNISHHRKGYWQSSWSLPFLGEGECFQFGQHIGKQTRDRAIEFLGTDIQDFMAAHISAIDCDWTHIEHQNWKIMYGSIKIFVILCTICIISLFNSFREKEEEFFRHFCLLASTFEELSSNFGFIWPYWFYLAYWSWWTLLCKPQSIPAYWSWQWSHFDCMWDNWWWFHPESSTNWSSY